MCRTRSRKASLPSGVSWYTVRSGRRPSRATSSGSIRGCRCSWAKAWDKRPKVGLVGRYPWVGIGGLTTGIPGWNGSTGKPDPYQLVGQAADQRVGDQPVDDLDDPDPG